LQQRENKLDALTVAWKGSFPAILASNLTVVGALLMLLFVDSPAIRNLGASGPIGLLVALPAVNAIVPRWIFWPFIPKPTDAD
ncbi:MMPL family transporter, partial [Klebsiella pneumoniae]